MEEWVMLTLMDIISDLLSELWYIAYHRVERKGTMRCIIHKCPLSF